MNAYVGPDDKRDMPRADEIIPRMKPTWGDDLPSTAQAGDKVKVTWMGHAAALAEMPLDRAAVADPQPAKGDAASVKTETTKVDVTTSGAGKGTGKERGVTILFDPAFSKKCSPTQWIGSSRYQRACTIPSGFFFAVVLSCWSCQHRLEALAARRNGLCCWCMLIDSGTSDHSRVARGGHCGTSGSQFQASRQLLFA